MANNPLCYATQAEASMNTWTAYLNSGYLQFMSGSQPAVDVALTGSEVAKLTFSSTAFANATSSVGVVSATANSIASDTNATGGTIGYAALLKSDGTTVVATCSAGTSGCDITVTSTLVSATGTVACSSFIVSQPQS